jgi:hypothetical protein
MIELDPTIARALLREQLEAGDVVLPAAGRSMEPTFHVGDRLVVTSPERTPARIGGVIVCDAGRSLVCHRLIARAPGWVLTCGDRSRRVDRPWRASAIVGVVRGREGDPPEPAARSAYYVARGLTLVTLGEAARRILPAALRRTIAGFWDERLP